jgi:hypothetical protein
MAKNNGNLFLNRFSGMVGDQMVLRKGKDGRTIMCAKPNYVENRTYSQAQLAQQKAFRDAITYAKVAKEQEVYKLKANGGPKSPFNVAVADWFKEPQVLGIDLSGWNGAAGGVVRVQAQDDVQVKRVIVRFSDANGDTLEEGAATDLGTLWWEYTTRSSHSGAVTVTATALDLPGNMAEESREKTIVA